MQSVLSNTCDLFLIIFEVFNEMEIEINVINNKIFVKLFKNKSKRKRNFIKYHFLVKSKPHERIDLLIIANVNIYQTKKKYFNSNVNMFFIRKTDQTTWNLPLSTSSTISEQFFHDPPLCPNFKKQNAPPLILGRGYSGSTCIFT